MPAQSRTMLYLQYLCLTAAFSYLVGCSESKNQDIHPEQVSSAPVDSQIKELVRGIVLEPDSLDPHKAMLQSEALEDLLEGLVVPTQDGGMAVGVSQSWITDDGLTYHFKLRQDAKWSNGDPVTAQDFIYAWRRAVDPRTASSCIKYFTDSGIGNAGSIANGEVDSQTLAVEAKGPYSLSVTLERPMGYFLQLLTHKCFLPLHEETIEKHADAWTRPEFFVGNGAFSLSERKIGERIALARNPTYWNAGNVRLDMVTYLSGSNTALLTRYIAGDVHITASLPDDHFPQIQAELPDEIAWVRPNGVFGFQVNSQKPPLDSPLVRRALAYALDRHTINSRLFNVRKPDAYTLSPPELLELPTGKPEWQQWSQAHREDRARQLLSEAGYSRENPLRVQLSYTRSENNTKLALAASAMWREILGAEVTIQQQEFKAMVERFQNADFELIHWGHGTQLKEPAEIYASCCISNDHYSSDNLADLIHSARSAQDEHNRREYYIEAESLLAQEMPFIPISHVRKPKLIKPHVNGVEANHTRLPLSKDLWLAEK
ncbi:peptide ABC transporter substrate-binding protein [Microbulbifer guangxiensis]|uniref:peptide ABC transporter substrate-binding protein n=1 Tax=Microbulbifer guangxiensis TaxID=2904249 RepID=UPI001F3B83F4|nr:peptide ABC transporter substrate-binding protein [Microbulbifer guangxiensis]